VYVFALQTKTDAAAFAVRVRASHKLETLTGSSRTKDEGRRGSWQGGAGTESGRQTMAERIEQIDELLKNGKLKQQFHSAEWFRKAKNDMKDLSAHKDEHLHTPYIFQ